MSQNQFPVVFLNEDGSARTTTLIIADGTDTQHKNVLGLVRTYLTDLEEFGRVAFQTRPFATLGGIQQQEIAFLNEQQSTLILTYMRNSEIVRGFKKRLVKAFWELTNQRLTSPSICSADTAAQACIHLTTAIGDLTAVLEKLNTQLANMPNLAAPQVAPKQQQSIPALPFFNAWWDCLAARDVTASDLCRIINGQQCQVLTQTATDLFGATGKLTGKKLGMTLRTWSQQIFNGFCVLNTGHKAKGSIVWRLERTQ